MYQYNRGDPKTHLVLSLTNCDKPKKANKQLTIPNGGLTENKKFYTAAQSYKFNLTKNPHMIEVYEKIHNGVLC